ESKVASLEAEKAKLEVTKASLRQEVETIKSDREKVVPYVALELVLSIHAFTCLRCFLTRLGNLLVECRTPASCIVISSKLV
nr:hypothetical protein [Tanacetum cinerariifolium]